MVLCTHLHVDHVGWNTRLDNGRWVPTFPTPSTCCARPTSTISSGLDRDPEKPPGLGGAMRDSVYPIVEAGLRADGRRHSRRSRSIFRSRPRPGMTRSRADQPHLAGKAGLLFRRHHSPRDPGLSPGLEQLRVRRSGKGAASRRKPLEKCAAPARCCCRSISARRTSATSTRRARASPAVCVATHSAAFPSPLRGGVRVGVLR